MDREQGTGSTEQSVKEAQPDQTCRICGKFGALEFGDTFLCTDCYTGCGSCCPEFGKDDLWQIRDDD